ncbi:AbrB family transcriptional regulator [Alphaproteobacteria bacterium KMM 3653]|uniref:AbrB family transcriptional regulator n=1 Tax=Harenicola maris TaxID=2841044 RepID=A0AAP2CRX3_9RHOB|nr:AbrB family transcriptional regulator [Harenicola maris]
MSPAHMIYLAFILASGALGGLAGNAIGFPLPFLTGALITVAIVASARVGPSGDGFTFPDNIRMGFMSLIGVAIGAQIDRDLVLSTPDYLPSLLGIAVFCPLAHWANYRILRGLGKYPPADAFFAGAPGGFIESVTLAEENGADIPRVTVQHFLRIVLVLFAVPFGLSLYLGHRVGSVVTLSGGGSDGIIGLAIIAAIGLAGLVIGSLIRLPARQLTGPMLLAGAISVAGFDVPVAHWLVLPVAQVIVGSSLGLRFVGIKTATLIEAAGMTVLCLLAMGAIGLVLVVLLHQITGISVPLLVLTYTPGGLTEMGLIALTLSGSAAVVVMHHIMRIILTVVNMGIFLRVTGLLKR